MITALIAANTFKCKILFTKKGKSNIKQKPPTQSAVFNISEKTYL